VTAARCVFPVMGTMTSIVVSGQDVERMGEPAVRSAMAAAQAVLERLDHRFSHYSVDSEISRWLCGSAVSPDTVAEFTHVLAQCGRLRDDSDGVFTIKNPVTGTVDTAGYVKGYAIGVAAAAMREKGLANFILTVGGDSTCVGSADAGRPWRVAVADPERSHGIAAIIDASDLAVATSGTAERGEHIRRAAAPAPTPLASFTVTGPDIAEADAYATIGFALGEAGLAWVAAHDGYHGLAIRSDGSIVGDVALVSAA
jgi:FAD:protein FMN transferase